MMMMVMVTTRSTLMMIAQSPSNSRNELLDFGFQLCTPVNSSLEFPLKITFAFTIEILRRNLPTFPNFAIFGIFFNNLQKSAKCLT